MPSPDAARLQKARELAERAQIVFQHGAWWVPSQSSGTRHRVIVDAMFASCSCEDFQLRDQDCKHILAVRLFVERQQTAEKAGESAPAPIPPSTVPAPKVKRPTYKQDWPNYNRAQTQEKRHFQEILFDLCRGLVDNRPHNPKGGGQRLPLADAVFAVLFKVYSTVSARRFMCDLEDAHGRGFLSRLPHYNSIPNYLEDAALSPILTELIRLSSLPLSQVETTFAGDSTGFSTSRFVRWFDIKYGVTRESAVWVKAHFMTGVRTNIITAVTILDPHAADSPQLPGLVKTTAQGFTVKEVCTDKAYTGTENFEAVAAVGGTLYSAFKSNATGGVGGVFEKAFHYFCLNREEFLKHYHQRSNVESTCSMVKAKFRDHVRSKSDTAMKNEVLCKLLCHNICCLISAMYELKITPVFFTDEAGDGPADILPMVRPG